MENLRECFPKAEQIIIEHLQKNGVSSTYSTLSKLFPTDSLKEFIVSYLNLEESGKIKQGEHIPAKYLIEGEIFELGIDTAIFLTSSR